jgi:N12 class adenine-specific DNA methylase
VLVIFDAWQSVFATVTSEWELAPTGMDYRLISRFSKFNKVPELMTMYQSFADVVTKKRLRISIKGN